MTEPARSARRAASPTRLARGDRASTRQARGEVAIVATELATNLARYARDGRMLIAGADLVRRTARLEMLAIDAGPGWPTCSGACRTASRPAARRATGSARSGGCPASSTCTRRRSAAPWSCRACAGRRPRQRRAASGVRVRRRVDPGAARRRSAATPGGSRSATASCAVHGRRRARPRPARRRGRDAGRAPCSTQTPFDERRDVLSSGRTAPCRARAARPSRWRSDRPAAGVRYAGVGNISGALVSGERSRGLVSQNGTVGAADAQGAAVRLRLAARGAAGHALGRPQQPLVARRAIPACSCGIRRSSPACCTRDFGRGRDDATIVVVAPAA